MLYRETSLCAEGEYEMSYQIKIIAQIYKLHTSKLFRLIYQEKKRSLEGKTTNKIGRLPWRQD